MCIQVPAEARKRHWIPWHWGYRQLWVLGTKPGFPMKEVSTLNWAISPVPELTFNICSFSLLFHPCTLLSAFTGSHFKIYGHGACRGCSFTQNWNYKWLWAAMWVLRTEPPFSASFSPWAFSPCKGFLSLSLFASASLKNICYCMDGCFSLDWQFDTTWCHLGRESQLRNYLDWPVHVSLGDCLDC